MTKGDVPNLSHLSYVGTQEGSRLCEKALFPLFVIAMKAPHFCHPETSRISLTREGSIFYNNAFVYRGVGNTCKF